MLNRLYILFMALCMVVFGAVSSFAAITMPTLPTTDLETAGTAILGLIAVGAVISVIIHQFKKA